MMAYQLDPLSSEERGRWDVLTAPYPARELFHRSAWLAYLAASRRIEIGLWAIREAGATIGYFAGGVLRQGPFRILGSPLRSWGSNFMGPVAGDRLDHGKLLGALDSLAARDRLAMIELEYRGASDEALRASGYEAIASRTLIVRLDPHGTDSMWAALESTCRNRVRKAMKSGLTVEDTDDPRVADEFYDQYADLMRNKGLVPPYPREYPRLLFQHLKGVDLLFSLRVRDKEGRVLATGLFPHDDRTMYFWGGASWQEGRDLCPNEFLHWSAMSLAAERGLASYDMCGPGRFKGKFGGTLLDLQRAHKCYSRAARWALRGYEFCFRKRMRIQGLWRRFRGRPLPATAADA